VRQRYGYVGASGWEEFAPGLKTTKQADEIRRRLRRLSGERRIRPRFSRSYTR
jgi:NADH dehydrogenase FAD-containing subunit